MFSTCAMLHFSVHTEVHVFAMSSLVTVHGSAYLCSEQKLVYLLLDHFHTVVVFFSVVHTGKIYICHDCCNAIYDPGQQLISRYGLP